MNRFICTLVRKSRLNNPISKSCNKLPHKYDNPKIYQHQVLPILPIFQYAFRGVAVISGRLINRWWRNLSADEKKIVFSKIRRNSFSIIATTGLFISFGIITYYVNLEKCKISGRKRLMLISSDQLNAMLGDSVISDLMKDDSSLPSSHPHFKTVQAIINTIIARNVHQYPELSRTWRLAICDNVSVVNAACLPTGELIVWTGLIEFVENLDQLAAVLAHELAHVLLEHGRETVSRGALVANWTTLLGFVLWVVVPGDFLALLTNWLKNKVVRICLELPYSRMLETEADVVGLMLMAQACFKVEEARKFWELMDIFEKRVGVTTPDFLSTHPSSNFRAEQFKSLMPMVQEFSKECGCHQEDISWFQKIIKTYSSKFYLKTKSFSQNHIGTSRF